MMHAGKIIACFLVFSPIAALSGPGLPAADDAEILNAWNIKVTLEGRLLHQETNLDEAPGIRMPDYLREEKIKSELAGQFIVLRKDNLTDNPLFHGAMYMDLGLVAVKGGVRFAADITAEHRGMSYGVYTTDNTVVYTKYNAALDTAFQVKGEKLEIAVSAGNYDDCSLYEGLAVFNVDVQGMYTHFKWRNFKLWHNHIGDFYNGIGLNIEDAMDYALSLEDIDLFDLAHLNLKAGYYYYPMQQDQEIDIPSRGAKLSIALTRKGSLRIYSQLGIRDVGDAVPSGIERCAHLAGCRYHYKGGKIDISLVAERRFYGRYFNWGYKNAGSGFLYRSDTRETNFYKNTVGKYLYPLSLYLRPFGQWAVYTEYQGRDVQSMIFRAEARYDLPAGFFIDTYLDFNYIEVSNEPSFLYPFFDMGIGWEPHEHLYAMLSWTNRAMNLDKHYPTLYLLDSAATKLEFGGLIEF